jgi:hypothetical protein
MVGIIQIQRPLPQRHTEDAEKNQVLPTEETDKKPRINADERGLEEKEGQRW